MYKIQEIVCIVFPYFISKFFTLEEERQLFNAHISILNLCQSHFAGACGTFGLWDFNNILILGSSGMYEPYEHI